MIRLITSQHIPNPGSENLALMLLAGLSTDEKPTPAYKGVLVANGSKYIEIDTGKEYLYDEAGGEWHEQPEGDKKKDDPTAEEISVSRGSADAGKVIVVGNDGKLLPVDLEVGEGQIAVDGTLTIAGAAAGAKETGDAIASLNTSLGDLNADLDAIKNNMFSADAKYALAELLKNVISADENAKQLYENLINAMGVDMLKENRFIYLPNEFGDLSLEPGSLVVGNVGKITNGLGINHNAGMSNKRRIIGIQNDITNKQSYMSYQDGTKFNLVPIPVPETATSAWIGVFPSERYVSSRLIQWDESNNIYTSMENQSQYTKSFHIKNFSKGNNMYLALMTAYDALDSAYSEGPEAVVVIFKE